jgi:hypothetical protein
MPITDAPYLLEPTGNPIAFEIEQDNYVVTPSDTSVCTLEFPTTPTNGQTLKLAYADKALTFTFQTTTDTSGLSLPLSTSVALLAQYLSVNYDLVNDFVIRADIGSSLIELTAKVDSEDYDITCTGTYAATFNQTQAGVAEVVQDNYSIITTLLVEEANSTNDHAKVVETQLYLNPTTRAARVDFARLLHNHIAIELPMLAHDELYELKNQPVEYFMRYAEKYGSTATVKRYSASSKRWAWRGRFDLDNTGLYGDYNAAHYFEEQWLTLQPTNKTISTIEKDYLCFLNAHNYSACTLNISAKLSNGSTVTGTVAFTFADSNPKMLVVPISYAYLAAQLTLSGNSIVTASVSIGVSGTRKTRVMKYTFIEHCEGMRYYVYLNSIGGWESMRTNSVFTKGVKVEQAQYMRPYTTRFENTEDLGGGEYDLSPRAEVMNSEAVSVEYHNGGSGSHAQEWAEHFAKQFGTSERRFEYDPVDDRLIPIILTTKDFGLKHRKAGNHFFRFSYTHAYTNSYKHSSLATNGRDASFSDTSALPND